MLDNLMVVANVAIVFGVIYKLFELYVGRKERMMLIEKLPPESLAEGKFKGFRLPASPAGLRIGCLLFGLGVGILIGYIIVACTKPLYDENTYFFRMSTSIVYTACTLMGGGMGLLVSFLIEVWREKKLNQNSSDSDNTH